MTPASNSAMGTLARRMALPIVAVLLVAACAVPDPASPMPTGPAASPVSTDGPPTAPRPIIVDTDVDVSDVGALIVLLRDPSVDVLAVTITPVGTGVTDCAAGRAIIRYVLEEMGASEIPFACGEVDAGPDAIPFPPEWRSDADAAWGLELPARPQTDLPESAVDLLVRTIEASPTPPLLVPLGPWTNLEDAFEAAPGLASRVAGIFAMASAIDADGNVFTETVSGEDRLEWNVAADPSAFVSVFELGIPLTLVPLDATDDVPMDPSLLERLTADHDAAGADIVYELFIRVPNRLGDGQQLWDELAALALGDPDLVTWEEATLSADASGRLDRDQAGRTVRFATAADRGAAESAFLAALGRGGPRTTPFAVSGEIRLAWDGTSCSAVPLGPLGAGMILATFENRSGLEATAVVVFAGPPHSWQDVVDALVDFDPTSEEPPPEWIEPVVFLGDEGGGAGPFSGAMVARAGTYGPVCIAGEWPEFTFTSGQPFEIADAP